ncbi:MAG TPA: ATP-binding protein [bacterium]|jgi:predicted ATP-dependent endonuclease of OLD family|nr:ATP-binding protein [bacterium]HPY15685.1 ATP-binding protein [bacterium]HQB08990.1 ATP-binding protein [bacterium]HQM83157.1 ATP-binding protein [bacterium]
MILSYGAKNFFCFKEWVEISFELGSSISKELSNGENASLALCLKGNNSSGKTNGLKILSFLSYFCADSFTSLKPDGLIPLETFFNNKENAEFFVEFIENDKEYRYELIINSEQVISERIYQKKKRRAFVFERNFEEITKNTFYSTSHPIKLRKNASFISTARQSEVDEILPIYNFFNNIITNVSHWGLEKWMIETSEKDLSEFYSKNPEYLEFTVNKLREFDSGIKDIAIMSYEKDMKKEFYPLFKFDVDSQEYTLSYRGQSSGTKALFSLLRLYKYTLNLGGILVLDEFDIYLHPDILPHLVALFENPITNPKNAQLVFTTHNADIIDKMGKYRTYLFNKEDNESYCYRLDELPGNLIRNDRLITPLYKSKKIGGVPKI